MKKVLMLVNTYYQLMVAIRLLLVHRGKWQADLLLSDHSCGFVQTAEGIRSAGLFSHVLTVETQGFLHPNTFRGKLEKCAAALSGRMSGFKDFRYDDYDEFYFHNLDLFSQLLFEKLLFLNHNLSCYRFEEGYSSYFSDQSGSGFSRLRGKTVPGLSNLQGYWFCEPDWVQFQCDYPLKRIAPVQDGELEAVMKQIFSVRQLTIPECKILFFEESFYAERGSTEDVTLVQGLAALVGRGNLRIKRHPRVVKDRFADLGIQTFGEGVPWEILFSCCKEPKPLCITISSGSVLAPFLWGSEPAPTVFLYRCVKQSPAWTGRELPRYLHNLAERCNGKLSIPDKWEELWELIEIREKLYVSKELQKGMV